VVELLEAVPAHARSSGSLELLGSSPKRRVRLKQLRAEIKQARQQGDTDALAVGVEEYLQLRPDDEKMLALRDEVEGLLGAQEEVDRERRRAANASKARAEQWRRRGDMFRRVGPKVVIAVVLFVAVILPIGWLVWVYVSRAVELSEKNSEIVSEIRQQTPLVLSVNQRSVEGLAFTPDSTRLVSFSSGSATMGTIDTGEIHVWSLSRENGPPPASPIKTYPTPVLEARSLGINQSGTAIVLAGIQPTGTSLLSVWDLEVGQERVPLSGIGGEVRGAAFSPDGQYVVAAWDDFTVRVWDSTNGTVLQTLGDGRQRGDRRQGMATTGHKDVVFCVSVSPDGSQIASGSFDKTVMVWRLSPGSKQPVDISKSAPGTRAKTSASSKPVMTLKGHTGPVAVVAYSPSGDRIASGGSDTRVLLWNTETGNESLRLAGHNREVTAFAFSADGRYLASGSQDKTIRLWDLDTGRLLLVLEGRMEKVASVSMSSDGKWLASGDTKGNLLVWDISGLNELR